VVGRQASQHLQHLRRAGIVAARRDGKFVYDRLADAGVLDVLAALPQIAERKICKAERTLQGYFFARDSLEAVSREELLRRMRAATVTVLDVRPEDEFALGHLRGAASVPLRTLKSRLSGLNPAKEIIAYCHGPYCVLSFEAVAMLRTHGFRARRLEGGLPDWRAA
jgi:ArsR family transcriptional regulator